MTTAQHLSAGAVSFGYDGGALRHIRLGDTELLRGIAFLVRDRDWGTLAPQISDQVICRDGATVTIGYRATYESAAARLVADLRISVGPQGVDFTANAVAAGVFETNRAGFTVLHPITGVAGQAVAITHSDGRIVQDHFPDLIAPWQPFQDLRALSHRAGPWQVTCRMEGDTFEMEDQRQWGDASYKTYVRPLALPWPYVIADGAGLDQAVRLRWQPVAVPAAPVTTAGRPAPVAPPRWPETALVITAPEAAIAARRPGDLGIIGVQRLLCHYDATCDGAAELADFAALQAACPAAVYDLELIARCDGDLDAEFARHAAALRQAGLRVASVMVCPSVDRGSTPPGSAWPPCPDLRAIHAAAARAFPGMVMGGGMASFFPELNRKRPPDGMLDFVTHGLCPIIHAADDLSVMETLETVAHITRSARAIIGRRDYRIGPATIAMRQNPYGSRTIPNPGQGRVCMTDDDPRHRSAFGAAYVLGLAAALAPAAVTVWTPAALYGPRGVMAPDGRPYPLTEVITALAAQAGKPVQNAAIVPHHSAQLAFGDVTFEANLAAAPRDGMPAYGWTQRPSG